MRLWKNHFLNFVVIWVTAAVVEWLGSLPRNYKSPYSILIRSAICIHEKKHPEFKVLPCSNKVLVAKVRLSGWHIALLALFPLEQRKNDKNGFFVILVTMNVERNRMKVISERFNRLAFVAVCCKIRSFVILTKFIFVSNSCICKKNDFLRVCKI